MAEKRQNVPQKKVDIVKELSSLAKNSKTIMVASIKNLPASQFQEIVKKLRGNASVKVPKKNLIFMAIDESGHEDAKNLKDKIGDSTAVLFSDIDSFELASELLESKKPAGPRIGQEAPNDIEVPAGPTDLVPGPAISELGALGIQIQIDKGKINIKEPKVIVNAGEKISPEAASIMTKLDIKPFSVGFIPICAFDTEKGTLYTEINIDKEGTIEELKNSFSKALAFAVERGYASEDTIKHMLAKASAYANKLHRIMTGEPEPVAQQEESSEEPKEETKPEKEEHKESTEGLASLFG